jgi:hypothetical protein
MDRSPGPHHRVRRVSKTELQRPMKAMNLVTSSWTTGANEQRCTSALHECHWDEMVRLVQLRDHLQNHCYCTGVPFGTGRLTVNSAGTVPPHAAPSSIPCDTTPRMVAGCRFVATTTFRPRSSSGRYPAPRPPTKVRFSVPTSTVSLRRRSAPTIRSAATISPTRSSIRLNSSR